MGIFKRRKETKEETLYEHPFVDVFDELPENHEDLYDKCEMIYNCRSGVVRWVCYKKLQDDIFTINGLKTIDKSFLVTCGCTFEEEITYLIARAHCLDFRYESYKIITPYEKRKTQENMNMKKNICNKLNITPDELDFLLNELHTN
jgi:hypothetical protein